MLLQFYLNISYGDLQIKIASSIKCMVAIKLSK